MSGGGSLDRRQLQQAMMEAQASIQMQAQQQLSERMQSLCFKRCITSPVDKLADRQRRCLDQCLGAFMEGFGVAVSLAYALREETYGVSQFTHLITFLSLPPPSL